MTNISIEKAIKEKNAVFIDVRSENEFEADHIPDSINIPILDNEERHIVGYTYKKAGKDKAVDIGWKIFNRKIKGFEKVVDKNKGKKIIFCCFRGGLRSGCFADHFKKAYKLDGGYKSYRRHVREELEKIKLPKKIIVLYGLTGAGKTEIIKKLENAIDLEGLARHRSSLFGGVGLNPQSQKMFETNLLCELKKKRKFLILEGESRKIGNAIIPQKIFDAMQKAKKINIVCGIKKRAKRIVKEYFDTKEKIKEIKTIVPKLKRIISKKRTDEYLKLLKEKKYYEFTESMLLDYYDPRYQHSVKDMVFDAKVSSDNIKEAVKKIEIL